MANFPNCINTLTSGSVKTKFFTSIQAEQKCTADFDFRNILNETNPTMHFRKICTVGFNDKPNRALCTLGFRTQGCV